MRSLLAKCESGSESPPDLLDSKTETTTQETSQNRAFAVTDTRRNFLDAGTAGSQEVYGAFHPDALEVSKRRFPEHILHASNTPAAALASLCLWSAQ